MPDFANIDLTGGGLATAAGISQGLLQGVQMYMQTQNMLQEQAIKKRLANAQSIEAFTHLYHTLGDEADQYRSLLGVMPTGGSQESQPAQGPAQSSQPINPSLGTDNQASGSQQILPKDVQRQIYHAPEMLRPTMLKQAELQLPAAQNELYARREGEFRQARDNYNEGLNAFNKAWTMVKNASPGNIASVKMQLSKLDLPGQAARMGTLDRIDAVHQLGQAAADWLSGKTQGIPSELTREDLMRVMAYIQKGNSDTFHHLQQDELARAKELGLKNTGYVNVSQAGPAEKAARDFIKNDKGYRPGGGEDVAKEIGGPAPIAYRGLNFLGKAAKGFLFGDEENPAMNANASSENQGLMPQSIQEFAQKEKARRQALKKRGAHGS